MSHSLWKTPPHTGKRTKGDKANHIIFCHKNSFDLVDPLKGPRGLPNIPRTDFEDGDLVEHQGRSLVRPEERMGKGEMRLPERG